MNQRWVRQVLACKGFVALERLRLQQPVLQWIQKEDAAEFAHCLSDESRESFSVAVTHRKHHSNDVSRLIFDNLKDSSKGGGAPWLSEVSRQTLGTGRLTHSLLSIGRLLLQAFYRDFALLHTDEKTAVVADRLQQSAPVKY